MICFKPFLVIFCSTFLSQLPDNFSTLCQWKRNSSTKISELTNCLVQLLQTSNGVYIVCPPQPVAMGTVPTPWHRPRPSVLAFHIVHCLRAIAFNQGWVWTNDSLIRAHLWPLLQQWNANRDAVREATIVCTVRLIGKLSDTILKWKLSLILCSGKFGMVQKFAVYMIVVSWQLIHEN